MGARYFFSEDPYVVALNKDALDVACSKCFASRLNDVDGEKPTATSTMMKCDRGCERVVYCNETCMSEDRLWHAAECSAFRLGNPIDIVASRNLAVRLMGRLFARLRVDGGKAQLSIGFPNHLAKDRQYNDLMSHDREFNKTRDKYRETVLGVYKSFNAFFVGTQMENVRFKEFLHNQNVSKINGFSIANLRQGVPGVFVSYGEGIYLNASRFNHSCRPSLLFAFDGCRMIVRKVADDEDEPNETSAIEMTSDENKTNGGDREPPPIDTRNMTKREFESMTFNYGCCNGSIVPTTRQRLESLEFRYFFRCRCELCRDRRSSKIQEDSAPVECPKCAQPFVWTKKRKFWSLLRSRLALRQTCSCRGVKRLDPVRELLGTEDLEKRMEALLKSTRIPSDQEFLSAIRFWHPTYNLKFGQMNERILRCLWDNQTPASTPPPTAANANAEVEKGQPPRWTMAERELTAVLQAGERMIRPYGHYAQPHALALTTVYHRLATMYMMRESDDDIEIKIDSHRRAAELCCMAAKVWRSYGNARCAWYMIDLTKFVIAKVNELISAKNDRIFDQITAVISPNKQEATAAALVEATAQ